MKQGVFASPRQLELPAGLNVGVFAAGLTSARFLAVSPRGDLFVSLSQRGSVVALPDRNADGVADEAVTFAAGLSQPHGLAFRDGWLYVAETNRVVRFPYRPGDLQASAGPEVVVPKLPAGAGHWTRTIAFGPDGNLYISVGSSCNVCQEADPHRAAILRYDLDRQDLKLFARGLRNAVGIRFQPGSGQLWATNNGRDWLGDDAPPETINVVTEGADFGWPGCHAGRIPDPQLGRPGYCEQTAKPLVEMQAHAAPLGLTFAAGARLPAAYRDDLFVAFHGSWNRSVPTGYKVVRIPLRGGTPSAPQDFITGWLVGGRAWGRPVDLVVGADGALYVSDDAVGAVYRVWTP
ncbi:MAG: sorbosone dehydrogenase family protein [Chloroflexi bacterium]|nr:sorbosone dehydrogenase family protein [Chloroflexota bacterium]